MAPKKPSGSRKKFTNVWGIPEAKSYILCSGKEVSSESVRAGVNPMHALFWRRCQEGVKPWIYAFDERSRRETTLSVKQIAARAHLGTSQPANRRLHQGMKAVPAIDASQEGIAKESMDDSMQESS